MNRRGFLGALLAVPAAFLPDSCWVAVGHQSLDAGAGFSFTPHGYDRVPAMLTPGEQVLTRAQQRQIADAWAKTYGLKPLGPIAITGQWL